MRYSEELIKKARILWESGFSGERVAKMLSISRRQTVQEWKQKFGWKRQELSSHFDDEYLQIWAEIRDKALAYIRTAEYKSVSEALKVFEKTQEILKVSSFQKEDTQNKPARFLKVLENYSDDDDVS